LDFPLSKSKGSDQMSLLSSRFVNVNAPPEAQDGSASFPAPVVNLSGAPLTFPVRGDNPIFHKFCVSPPASEKITWSPAAGQHPGLGTFGTGVLVARGCSLVCSSVSCTPVLTLSSPFVETSHQSRLELSRAFVDVYPTISRRFPSGD